MESIEFLGGRYNRPEQIMAGPVQAFRAQNAATGRTVFIHRVSTTESPEEQAALLKLLTTALVKSADAKRLVLDFGEESGYWYVVTESDPQCALLREWLQLEIDAAMPGAKVNQATLPPTVVKPVIPADKADPGEFTRFIQQRPATGSPTTLSRLGETPVAPAPQPDAPLAAGEFTRLFQASQMPSQPGTAPVNIPIPPAAPDHAGPGEFTRFFSAGEGGLVSGRPAQPAARAPVQPSAEAEKKEPGEFTRFFNEGLPVPPPKPAPSANPYVQRPNSPFPSLPSQPQAKPVTEPGEFTRMFSRPSGASAPASPPPAYNPPPVYSVPAERSDPMGFATPQSSQAGDFSDNLFNDKINLGSGQPPTQPKPSEFTSIFGAVGPEAPPIAPPSVVAAPGEKSPLEDSPDAKFKATQELPVAKPVITQNSEQPSTATAGAPSEFTKIMQGGYTPKPAAPAAMPAAGAGAAPGKSPISISVPPIKPPAVPNLGSASASVPGAHARISQHGASVSAGVPRVAPVPAFANVKIQAPPKAGANKTLIIFLTVLGILAIVLVVIVMIMMKGQ